MTQVPAGWYPDVQGRLRYWDGTAWTEHVAAPPQQGFAPHQAAPPRRRRVWPWVAGGGALVVVLAAVAGGAVVVSGLIRTAQTPSVSPADTVLAYNTAWNAHDCESANRLTVNELDWDDCEAFVDATNEYSDYEAQIMNQSVSGGTAQVSASESFQVDGGVQLAQTTYLLENHGGVWLISSFGSEE